MFATTYLARRLKQICVAECSAQTEYVIAFRVFRYGLHYGTVDDDEMFGGGLYWATLARIARVE